MVTVQRMDMTLMVVRNNEVYVKPPRCGNWVVYCIIANSKTYYGSSNNLFRRTGQHNLFIKNVLSGKELPKQYSNFKATDFQNGHVYEIVAYCKDKADALFLEKQMVRENPSCLNFLMGRKSNK